jgi:hypothetical protein
LFEERAEERDDGQTYMDAKGGAHLLFPNSKKRHRIGTSIVVLSFREVSWPVKEALAVVERNWVPL